MVVFDQLRISNDGKVLYIDTHVDKASYFDYVYITKITICTEDQVHETSPKEYFNFIYQESFDISAQKKDLYKMLDIESFKLAFNNTDEHGEPIIPGLPIADTKYEPEDLSHNMFFVYVECQMVDGQPYDPCTPCQLREPVTLGVTYDYEIFYNQAMNFTRELGKECVIPEKFIDFILNNEALTMAIETDHFVPAIGFWRNLLGISSTANNASRPCGCHG